jgi:C-terminal processing protease CtpA/Prc
MVARTRDTHCFIRSTKLAHTLGRSPPLVRVRRIQGAFVVTQVGAGLADALAPGDVVVSIDGKDADARAAMLADHLAASTPQSRDLEVGRLLLCGPDGSTAEITVMKADGRIETVRAPRAQAHWEQFGSERDGEIVTMLPGNIGYADLDRLRFDALDDMFETFKDAKAIIFDMRGYPLGTGWSLGARLSEKSEFPIALFESMLVNANTIGSTGSQQGHLTRSFLQRTSPTDKSRYLRPTFMLIDERTISQAEHTGLILKAANATTFVGSATAGANGDVTNFTVPGGMRINFTGQAVRHADGRQLQRVGLIPDIEVHPTIAGIHAGRDEVLEKAHEAALAATTA